MQPTAAVALQYVYSELYYRVLQVLYYLLLSSVSNAQSSITRVSRTCTCPSPFATQLQRSTALFKLLDTDNNGLIDAIEFVSAMACASGELLVSLLCLPR